MSFLDQRPSGTELELQKITKLLEEIHNEQNNFNGHLAAKIEEMQNKQNANTDKK